MFRDDYLEFFSVEDTRLQEFKRDLMILILKFLLIHVRLGTSLKKQKLRVSQEYCQIQLVSQVEVEYLKDLHLDYQWFQYYKW